MEHFFLDICFIAHLTKCNKANIKKKPDKIEVYYNECICNGFYL